MIYFFLVTVNISFRNIFVEIYIFLHISFVSNVIICRTTKKIKKKKRLFGRRTILLHLSGIPCQAIGVWTGTKSSTSNNLFCIFHTLSHFSIAFNSHFIYSLILNSRPQNCLNFSSTIPPPHSTHISHDFHYLVHGTMAHHIPRIHSVHTHRIL